MKKPNITEGEWRFIIDNEMGMYIINNEEEEHVHDCFNEANAKAISAVPDMIDALIKMQRLWWNEVYEFGYGKYNGDIEKSIKLADNDAYNQLMIEALKKAGCE